MSGPSRWFATMLAGLALLLTACTKSNDHATGGGGTTGASATASTATASPTPTQTGTQTPATTANLSGTWLGTWQNKTPDAASGTLQIQWVQQGPALSGSITIAGTPCLTGGKIAGALNGNRISFGAVQGQVQVAYTGIVSGATISGTYATPCGQAEGTWTATKK